MHFHNFLYVKMHKEFGRIDSVAVSPRILPASKIYFNHPANINMFHTNAMLVLHNTPVGCSEYIKLHSLA